MVLLLVTLLVLAYALQHHVTDETARALTFTTLVIGNLGLILVNRSWQHTALRTFDSRNPALWWVIGGAFAFLSLALTLPLLREVFHFSPISVQQFALCILAGLGSVVWFEVVKIFRRSAQ